MLELQAIPFVQAIPFLVALVGSSLAAAYDLRTTEIPDNVPYAMIAIALLFYSVQSLSASNYWPLIYSAVSGAALFGFGLVMYHFGQWGGGDAKLLAAIGFLLPTANVLEGFNGSIGLKVPGFIFPFPASYLFNVFFVGAGYMLIYASILALRNKKIIFEFNRDVKASANIFFAASSGLLFLLIALNWILYSYFQIQPEISSIVLNSVMLTTATMGIFLVWKFARAVENVGFKKKIPVRKLRIGDVLLDSKVWEGLTENEVKKIKRSGRRYVVIKEGVRFAMAFPLALLFTIYFGDAILFLVRILG
jgi:hypothetical protein